MEPEPSTLEQIAAAIVAGKDVDWAAIEAGATAEVRVLLPHLRVLGRVRGVRGGADTPMAWGPLRLLEHVGNGSFGEVYRAWDDRLAREVALKLLWPDPVLDPQTGSAVVAEARRLARVRHPNVVTVYGADRIAGRVGIWMEFVRGETLAAPQRGGAGADPVEVARIGEVLGDALGAVHRAGVVHGDVKPANVVREQDGRLVLMDFGAGRETAHDRHDGAAAVTPLYAAPEILAGRSVSPASDVYSLGVLLYHLLTGAYPVSGATVREIHDAHLAGRRSRLSDVPSIPAALASAIDRALSPLPEGRFQTAREMAAALAVAALGTRSPRLSAGRRSRRLSAWAASAAGVAVAAGFAAPSPSRAPTSTAARPASMLIVPPEGRTPDPGLETAVLDLLERELGGPAIDIVREERTRETLRLMKRPREAGLDPDSAREVALRDGIDAVLTGRIDAVGDRYVVAVEVEAPGSGGVLLRAAENAADAAGVLGAAERLAPRIRSSVVQMARAAPMKNALPRVTTPSLRALELYARAAALTLERTASSGDQWTAAAELLDSALREDPDFGSAHILRAMALENMGRPASEFLPHAETASGLADSATEAERYFIRGMRHTLRREPEAAIPFYESLVRLDPSHYWGVHNLALMYEWTGRLREAVPYAVRRADLRPDDTFDNTVAAEALTMWAHRPAAARKYVDRVRAQVAAGITPWRSTVWAEAFPAVERWLDGDVAGAKPAVDELAARLDKFADRDRDRWALTVTNLYLSLGRIDDAEAVAATISETFGGPDRGLAGAALAREDPALARSRLEAWCGLPYWPAGAPELGALVGADRCVERLREVPDPTRTNPDPAVGAGVVQGLMALRRHRHRDAVALLTDTVGRDRLGGPSYMLARDGLSSAYDGMGKVREAVQVLEGTDRYMALPYRGQPAGHLWLRLRLRLADRYRRLDRVAEAEAVERDLRLRLAVADPDHPIVLALQERSGQ